jgi:phosphoribosylformylglycinamidine cyclo-ligase
MIDQRSAIMTTKSTYDAVGVSSSGEQLGLEALLVSLRKTMTFGGDIGRPLIGFGYFATVQDLGDGRALAHTTDGVGTKIIVAQLMDDYSTVGIDCVAMNVNDIICVGAKPLGMVDYIALEVPDPELLGPLGVGFLEGARLAGIPIPGGEIAQVREMIRSVRSDRGFDLSGAATGLVPVNRIITGQNIVEGDIIVGLASSGVHSNGLTLARKALLEDGKLNLADSPPELRRSLGKELLEPTRIYVNEVMQMLDEDLSIKALVHITSDGFLNLARVTSDTGFVIDQLPDPPPIFGLIQTCGRVPDEEMFHVFNMGVGFCVVVAPSDVERVLEIASAGGEKAWVLGHCIHDPEKKVVLPTLGMIGRKGRFFRA